MGSKNRHVNLSLISTLLGSCVGEIGLAPGSEPEAATDEVGIVTRAETLDHVPVPTRELVITDVSVVDDSLYTAYRPDKFNTDPEGGWSFGRLMTNLSRQQTPTPAQLTAFVNGWLKLWEAPQNVGSFSAPARPAMRTLVIDPWRAESGCAPDPAPLGLIDTNDRCTLDFTKAPFRLLAVVNRPDLRIKPKSKIPGMAGQGRYVFGVLGKDATGAERKLAFTVIFEYQLPISKWKDVRSWGQRWHNLGRAGLSFGPVYNAELYNVTRDFTRWNVMPGQPNGSAILQVRTNEVSLSGDSPKTWEMREFGVGSNGQLQQIGLAQEPDISFNGTPYLATWLNSNAVAVEAGKHHIPSDMLAARTLVVAGTTWQVPGVAPNVVRSFALSTCSGCHLAETGGVLGTNFLHVKTRLMGAPAGLSPFLQAELQGVRLNDFQVVLKTEDADQIQSGPGLDHGHAQN